MYEYGMGDDICSADASDDKSQQLALRFRHDAFSIADILASLTLQRTVMT